MKNVLLIGLGRFGRYTASKLYELGHQVMAVDKDEERVSKVLNYVTNAVIGDGTDKDFIASLGVPNYDLCIVAIGDDFLSSLETTSLLKDYGAKKVVSRATMASQEKFLLRNGADYVVFPERQLGTWTAIRYSSDNIENFFELMDGYAVFEVRVPDSWDGRKIGELDVRKKYGVNILGIRRPQEKIDMNIAYDTVLRAGQTMLILGKQDDMQKILKL